MRHCASLGPQLAARPLATTYPAIAQRQFQLLALPRRSSSPRRCLMNSHAHRTSTTNTFTLHREPYSPTISNKLLIDCATRVLRSFGSVIDFWKHPEANVPGHRAIAPHRLNSALSSGDATSCD